MAISFVTQASSTVMSMPMPPGIIEGDLIVVASGTFSGNGETMTSPGYTFVTTQKDPAGGTAQLSISYKFSDGTESGKVVTGPQSGNSLGVVVFRGVNPSNPIAISELTKAQVPWSLTHTFPAITTTNKDFILWVSAASGPTSTRTATFANKLIDQAPSGKASLFVAYTKQSSAGTTNPESTLKYSNSSSLSGAMIALPLVPDPSLPPAPPEVTKVGANAYSINQVKIPAGVQRGDIIVLVSTGFSGNSTTLPTTGYTALGVQKGGGGEGQVCVWYKVADGGESNSTIYGPTGGATMSTVVLRGISNVMPVELPSIGKQQETWRLVHKFPNLVTQNPCYVLWIDGTMLNASSRVNTFPTSQLLVEYKGTASSTIIAGFNQTMAGPAVAVSYLDNNSTTVTSDAMWGIPFIINTPGPKAYISASKRNIYGKPITISATATGSNDSATINTYSWSISAPGDTSPALSNPANSSVVYFSPSKNAVTNTIGTPAKYKAKITITDSTGTTSDATYTVPVKVNQWVKGSSSILPVKQHAKLGATVYPVTASAPDAPVASVSSAGLLNSLSVTWTKPAVNGAEIVGYEVWKSTTAGAETLLTTLGAQNLSYVDGSVSTSSPTYYQIKAINIGGKSPLSAEVSATATSVIPPIVAGYYVEDF